MKALSGRDFAKILERKGWTLVRVHGSHHIYIKKGRTERISLPVHKNQTLKIGLQKHLMKLADVTEDDLS